MAGEASASPKRSSTTLVRRFHRSYTPAFFDPRRFGRAGGQRDMHDRLRVLAWPGLGARGKNPYTWLLYSHLASLGVRVEDFTVARALGGGYDVFHVHWPDKALTAGPWV